MYEALQDGGIRIGILIDSGQLSTLYIYQSDSITAPSGHYQSNHIWLYLNLLPLLNTDLQLCFVVSVFHASMTLSLSCSIQYKKHRVQLVISLSTCKLQLIPNATTLQKPICNFKFKWRCRCKCACSCFGSALGLQWHWHNSVFSNGESLLVCFYAQNWCVVQTKVHVCALGCPFPLPPPKIHLIVVHLPLHPHPLTLNLWRIL